MFIERTINKMFYATVSPLAYLIAIQGALAGLSFTILNWTGRVSDYVLLGATEYADKTWWSLLILTVSILLLISFKLRRRLLAMGAAFVSCLCWLYAYSIHFAVGDHIGGLPELTIGLGAGYIYMAADHNRLWRPPLKDEEIDSLVWD